MLFKNAIIVTMNATRDIISDGAIAIKGNRIVSVDKTAALLPMYGDDEVIDVQGKLIIPGLIDTHVHLAQALIRGCADDMALIQWLCERVWVLQGNFTTDDGYVSARLCIAEMLKSGTTTFLESMLAHRYGFDGIARAVDESGIRACLAGIVMDIGTYATQDNAMHPGMIESRETSLLGVLDMHSKWNGAAADRIHVWFGPRTPGGVSGELYREMSELAHLRDMGITMHLAEVEADKIFLNEKYGLSPVAYAESVGLLGPKTVLVHMVWLTREDIEKLAATRTSVSHNPSSNSKLASGVCKVPQMLASGVNVALGCDGRPSSTPCSFTSVLALTSSQSGRSASLLLLEHNILCSLPQHEPAHFTQVFAPVNHCQEVVSRQLSNFTGETSAPVGKKDFRFAEPTGIEQYLTGSREAGVVLIANLQGEITKWNPACLATPTRVYELVAERQELTERCTGLWRVRLFHARREYQGTHSDM